MSTFKLAGVGACTRPHSPRRRQIEPFLAKAWEYGGACGLNVSTGAAEWCQRSDGLGSSTGVHKLG